MKHHPDVLAAHAEFGGDLQSMQALYDRHDHIARIAALEAQLAETKISERRYKLRSDLSERGILKHSAAWDAEMLRIEATPPAPKAVGWETPKEWELEQRAFHWIAAWPEEKTRALINDLWEQYRLAAEPPAPAVTESPLEVVQRGYDEWAAKPHNKKWVKRLDGTPIPNDLVVCIVSALTAALSGDAS